ncbi:hypothetical protein [Phascolarctobacterium succinatutens]|uniref:hypothetical protein n=1 Tax=Phascolarctobacterium succinatutens TaxID=626940 RepID=UPI00307A7F13
MKKFEVSFSFLPEISLSGGDKLLKIRYAIIRRIAKGGEQHAQTKKQQAENYSPAVIGSAFAADSKADLCTGAGRR